MSPASHTASTPESTLEPGPVSGPASARNSRPDVTLRAGRRTLSVPTGLFLGGEFRHSSDGGTFTVVDPSTTEPIADVASATEADARAALDAAVAAQPSWAATSPRERSELLYALYQQVTDHAEDLAALQSLELGRALPDNAAEVTYAAEYLRWFAERACAIRGDFRTAPAGNGRILTHYRPVGPVLAVTPWNFPLAMVTRKLAPAMAAGCTVIAKPAQLTPLTMLYVARLCQRVGLPSGVFQVVPTSEAARVSALLEDERLRKFTFTGSTEVGQALASTAMKRSIRTSLELGGNAPFVVLSHADVDRAVDAAVAAKMRGGGQVCIAANRFLVHRDLAEAFTRGLVERMSEFVVGPGTHAETTLGPLASADQLRKVSGLVDSAVAQGARLLLGGGRADGDGLGDGVRTACELDPRGYWFPPTVLTDVRPEFDIAQQEIFGPVAAIQVVDSDEEALCRANETPFGLAAYVMGEKLEPTLAAAERIEAGMVGVNRGAISDASAPFGGVKQSGLGREGGFEGIEEYLEPVYIAVDFS